MKVFIKQYWRKFLKDICKGALDANYELISGEDFSNVCLNDLVKIHRGFFEEISRIFSLITHDGIFVEAFGGIVKLLFLKKSLENFLITSLEELPMKFRDFKYQ